MFTCCSLPFSTEAELTAHLWSPHLHPRGSHSCARSCGASFRSESGLAQHQQQDFHLKPPILPGYPFRCTVCKEDFQDLRVLDRHMDTVIHNIPCHWCREIQITQFEWDYHLLNTHRDKLEQYPGTIYTVFDYNPIINNHSLLPCPLCDRQFCLVQTYEYHMSCHEASHQTPTVTPASLAYCDPCARAFPSQSDLDQHTFSVHAPPTAGRRHRPVHPQHAAIRCLECDRPFGTQQALDQHSQAAHTAALLPPTAPQALRRNQVAAAPLAQFPCRKCPALFPTRVSLTHHTTTAHPSRTRNLPAQFSCNMCSKTFINQYALDQHMASPAHPEYVQQGGRPKVYKCVECPRTFDVKDMLTLHAASHVTQRLGQQ